MISLRQAAKPAVSIVTIGLREAPCLIRCLESVAGHVKQVDYEVQVVLCDPTERLLRELGREVIGAHLSSFRANLGFARASNYAVSRSRGRYIAFLNDDCVVQAGWLESLIDTAERREHCGIVSGTFLHPDGTLQEAGSLVFADGSTRAVGDGLSPGYMAFERRILYGSAGSWLVRRETWDEVGGLSEAYYPAYYEDLDFCLSAKEAGWDTWYQPASVVHHARSSSTTTTIRSFIQERSGQEFKRRWGHELAKHGDADSVELAVWHGMGCPTRILVIDDEVPDPSRGSGYGRMHDNLVTLARESDFQVTLHPRVPAVSYLSPIPGVRIVADLGDHLTTPGVSYDVVIVSRPHNAEMYCELIDDALPDAVKIYDAEALFHRRLELQATVVTEDGRGDIASEARAMKSRETAILDWADRVVCISASEAQVAQRLAPTPVDVVSPLFRAPRPTAANFWQRSGAGLVAGWAAGPGSPNSDGLLWFAREVMPRILARHPEFSLSVTGYHPPDDVRWLAGGQVDFVGEVKDLTDFYNRIRVAISPTRFGSGVKLKSVEAIQFGVPIVCTEEAANGLPPALEKAAWITSDAAQFAEAVSTLLSDELTWERQRSLCLDHRSEQQNASVDQTATWPDIVRDLVT